MRLVLIIFLISIIGRSAQAQILDVVTIDSKKLDLNNNWLSGKKSEREALTLLIRELVKSPTGKKLVTRAHKKMQEQDKALLSVIKVGRGSLTDSTLIRRFSAENPLVVHYRDDTTIIINKDLSGLDALMDLAHELTHFILRDPFNPYEGELSLKNFIVSTIEGRGGEVDAYLTECKVLKELYPKIFIARERCQKVYNGKNGHFSKKRGAQEFYKLGAFERLFETALADGGLNLSHFPYASGDQAVFISSAYGIPYPLAALKEFYHVKEKTCVNERRRLDYAHKRSNSYGRGPAFDQSHLLSKLAKDYEIRCSNSSSREGEKR